MKSPPKDALRQEKTKPRGKKEKSRRRRTKIDMAKVLVERERDCTRQPGKQWPVAKRGERDGLIARPNWVSFQVNCHHPPARLSTAIDSNPIDFASSATTFLNCGHDGQTCPREKTRTAYTGQLENENSTQITCDSILLSQLNRRQPRDRYFELSTSHQGIPLSNVCYWQFTCKSFGGATLALIGKNGAASVY